MSYLLDNDETNLIIDLGELEFLSEEFLLAFGEIQKSVQAVKGEFGILARKEKAQKALDKAELKFPFQLYKQMSEIKGASQEALDDSQAGDLIIDDDDLEGFFSEDESASSLFTEDEKDSPLLPLTEEKAGDSDSTEEKDLLDLEELAEDSEFEVLDLSSDELTKGTESVQNKKEEEEDDFILGSESKFEESFDIKPSEAIKSEKKDEPISPKKNEPSSVSPKNRQRKGGVEKPTTPASRKKPNARLGRKRGFSQNVENTGVIFVDETIAGKVIHKGDLEKSGQGVNTDSLVTKPKSSLGLLLGILILILIGSGVYLFKDGKIPWLNQELEDDVYLPPVAEILEAAIDSNKAKGSLKKASRKSE